MTTEFKSAEKLGVPIPAHSTHIMRLSHTTTPDERLKALQSGVCGYNYHSFPASMLACDFLSDGGCVAMYDTQWSALFRGDEAYGRNHGYFAVQDAVRDIFQPSLLNPFPLNKTLTVKCSFFFHITLGQRTLTSLASIPS